MTNKSKPKKGAKRAWCKAKLRRLFNVLASSNSARSKALQLNKAHIFCFVFCFFVIVTTQPASAAVTPVIMLGIKDASDAVEKTEKACTLLCKVGLNLALTAGKFVETKEGRTAIYWLMLSGVAKGVKTASLMATPSYGTAAIALALFCGATYGIETIIGGETFASSEFINQANKWCTQGYGLLSAASVLPKDAISIAIKLLILRTLE